MTTHPLSATVGKLRVALAPPTDGQLVARFVRTRDGAAFAALVDRHGPTVFGVVRRTVGDHHLAEDAFQAVFLVLARRAAVIDPPDAVGGWLFGVAQRTALEARTLARRRASRERTVADLPDVPTGDAEPSADLRAIIDAELAGLPPKYRDVLVACDLAGRPRAEVAAAFGLVAGTLSSRLAEARKRLADRLRRRGVTAAVGLAAAVEVPKRAVAAAQSAASGGGAVPAPVAALATRVTRSMLPMQSKLVMTVLLAAAVVAGSGVAGRHLLRADDPPPAPAAAKPAAKPAGPGKLTVWDTTRYVLLDPTGKQLVEQTFTRPTDVILTNPVLSPDGKHEAFTVEGTPEQVGDQVYHRRKVMVYPAAGGDGKMIEVNAMSLFWARDGKSLYAAVMIEAEKIEDRGFTTYRLDPATGEKATVELPKTFHAYSVDRTGAFVGGMLNLKERMIQLARVSAGRPPEPLTEVRTEGSDPKTSPDGGKVLFRDLDPDEQRPKDMPQLTRLFVYDTKAKTRTRLAEVPENADVQSFCWSPDGTKVAYVWKQAHPGVPRAENTENANDPKLNTETESFLVVADADGKNPNVIRSAKAPRSSAITLGGVDWQGDDQTPPAARAPAPVGKLYLIKGEDLIRINPDGTETEVVVEGFLNGQVSPDGRWLAHVSFVRPNGQSPRWALRALLRPLDGSAAEVRMAEDSPMPGNVRFYWSADSKRVLITESQVAGLAPGRCVFYTEA